MCRVVAYVIIIGNADGAAGIVGVGGGGRKMIPPWLPISLVDGVVGVAIAPSTLPDTGPIGVAAAAEAAVALLVATAARRTISSPYQ